jgi:pimeloyl-ACP methyl ester carboxylesterase
MEQRCVDLVRVTQVFHSRLDASAVVASWKKPLVVIGGDCDGLVSVPKSTGLANSAPNGRLHIMQGCGHFPNMERPGEFNAILADLVQSVVEP